MAQSSLFDRNELFIASALIGVHASYIHEGFRHRDIKFLIELFSNWIEHSLDDEVLTVQNTQIMRYMTVLINEGYARKINRTGYPRYRLTRIGLLELLSRMVNHSYLSVPNHFFFLYYFVKNYRPRIEQLVKEEGKQFPVALRLELEALLDEEALIKRELENVERELTTLKERIADAKATADYVLNPKHAQQDFDTMVQEVEALYPYELNSLKPLSELISEIPEDLRFWELSTGNRCRVEEIWEPGRGLLLEYHRRLVKLQADYSG